MNKSMQLFRWLLVLCLIILLAQAALAGGPVGHTDTLEGDLRYALQDYLADQGYMGKFYNGQDLQRGIAAYLWDNRSWLKNVDFHNSRNVDAVICLLHKKSYPGFDGYLNSEVVSNWCNQTVQKP
jgi:hypothetical protein